jgi:hypothetical protein
MSGLLSFDVSFEVVSPSMLSGHLKAYDVTEVEMNALFGKDLVARNGLCFEATLGDVPTLGRGLRRHQLLKSIEKVTKSQLITHSLSELHELWNFRRTPESLLAQASSSPQTSSLSLASPRPASPDVSNSPASSATASPAPAAAAASSDSKKSAAKKADGSPKQKKVKAKSASKKD